MANRENLELTSENWDRSDIEVGMGEWAEARDGRIIKTGGLGPCIGVAIYDPIEKSGYIAHTMGAEIETVIDLSIKLAEKIKNTAKLKVWISGGEISDEDEYYPEFREDVTNMILGLGVIRDNIEIKWIDNHGQWGNLTIDCGTGEGKIEIDSMDDDIEFDY
jgi:chemotaxis receptor (MCP) glutamine deamidase CheD